MKMKHPISSLIIGLACVGSAHASTQTVSLSSCSEASITTSLSSASPGPCASIPAGISFAPDAGYDLYIAVPGQSSNTDTGIGVDFPVGGNDNISFTTPITIFDAFYNQNFGGGSQSGSIASFTISTFLDGTPVDTFNFGVGSGTGLYYTIDSGPFNFLQVSQSGGFAVLSDITFGTSGAVPEPATWAMMLLGFGMVGYAMRKRAKVTTKVTYA